MGPRTARRPAPPPLRIALAQTNPVVGDLEGNLRRMAAALREARSREARLAVFPELSIPGYPPKDLVETPRFVEENRRAVRRLLPETRGLAAVVGFVERCREGLLNAAALLEEGRWVGTQGKRHLPTYDVFDEERYFVPDPASRVWNLAGRRVAVTICEDLWVERGPASSAAARGADLILNLSASPFHAGKAREREALLRKRARGARRPIVYVNQIGGQDDLVFDGGSYVVDGRGNPVAAAPRFEEGVWVATLPSSKSGAPLPWPPPVSVEEETYSALVLGTRDYVRKNGFRKAVVGLSGGIDSALTAAIAADALGPENVVGVTMPGPYSSPGSVADSRALAANLSIAFKVIPITPVFERFREALAPEFGGTAPDVAEENLQARIRGNLLMALSNKFGWMVLSTGNKSEMATGYCTLYGDMAGGLAVLSDVPKTAVYRLARHRNSRAPVIPEATFTKPPSAELRPGQTDQDTLPPYEVLDPILQAFVEERLSRDDIVARGFDRSTVDRVVDLILRNEYKRKQAPPGLKVTAKAFGSGRVVPITHRWRG
ncbi:MAG: NAD+ synthase [Halobacteria archaeon]